MERNCISMKVWFEQRTVDLGKVVITTTANEVLSRDIVGMCLFRHGNGDFGNMGIQDWKENLSCLDSNNGRVVSTYYDSFSKKNFYIITHLSDSEDVSNETTIMLVDEY